MDIYTSGFRKYEIIKLLNNIKKTIKRVEENVPTQIDNAINQLLDGAPEALDTLKELADALGNNPDIITELNNKIDSINTKKDWNQNDEDADDYIENRTHYLEEGKYIFYKPNVTSFDPSGRISLDDALDILNGIDNTYLTRSVIVRNISTSYSTHHKEKCQLIVSDGYLYLNTQYNNSNNDYTDFYNLNDFANRIKSINEEVTYNDIKTLLNNNSMTFNGNTNYFEKSDDIYHKLDKSYIPDETVNNIIEVTYSEIKSLRDNSELIPGKYYRITDYVTTTTQEETHSANHPFDIIVLALSENKLFEEAKAVQHEGDTYFNNSNLSAWKIWYCLDNDTNRFAWAQNYLSPESHQKMIMVEEDGNLVPYLYVRYPSLDSNGQLAWVFDNYGDVIDFNNYINNNNEDFDTGDVIYTTSEYPQIGDVVSMGGTNVTINSTSWGKGVIYRMIDEWDNDCPYDFKNIQFKRKLTDGVLDTDNGTDTWVYTFNGYNSSNAILYDMSANPFRISEETMQALIDDDDRADEADMCYGNKIGVLKYKDGYGYYHLRTSLNDNVFLGVSYDNGYDNGHQVSYCYSNNFGDNCTNNTFGINCQSNNFGDNCNFNTFGDNCNFNTFGNSCRSNNFRNGCNNNIFEDDCTNNTFGNSCSSNIFKTNCRSNTFGNSCQSNIFGNYCFYNTFGNSCSNNTFEDNCQSNTFGNSCFYNTFGNSCFYNTFGNDVRIDYVKNIRLGDECEFLNIISSDTAGSSSNQLQNVSIAQGVKRMNNNGHLTITIPDRNLNYETKVGYNSSGVLKIYCEADLAG